jgi:hypothetical protein
VQGGGVRARSHKCGGRGALDLGWLETIYREKTMPAYNNLTEEDITMCCKCTNNVYTSMLSTTDFNCN